ncbi:MAG: Por secretion system C-terminal sorting protein [Gemmatimonadetes bacterium]|nr:Por secretion system C-terminal sorting protein [Gemmatimonadota bacterium]
MSEPSRSSSDPDKVADLVTPLSCSATVKTGALKCTSGIASASKTASKDVVGGQNVYVKLTSSNVSYNAGTEIFQFDCTVQNLLNESIGTPNGVVPDVSGIRVFFHQGPTADSGTGTITVANADGTATFTGVNQPYFQYNEVLAKNAVSTSHTWQLNVPSTVNTFTMDMYLATSVQPLIIINELLANPGGTISDANGEWIELYNAGTLAVDLQNLAIADSAASGRRPYHIIALSVPVGPGGYVVLGNTTNTTNNGGVPVDYAYGAAMAFANSLDAFKIARVWGTDTLTLDRTQYASAAISAQNGISRELKNPALDNSNMDGSNWVDASVSSVYGPGGRGTPKAQNAGFTP